MESRSQAVDLIDSGCVLVSGSLATKPARLVAPHESIFIERSERRYVSRGGLKLEAALRTFQIDPSGRICLDVGASTGGFTDCLLQHGAARVYAVDVGRCQLHERLRKDPRVVSLEKTDARSLSREAIPEECEIVTVDVSFISAAKVIEKLLPLSTGEAAFIVLIKPQFEAGKSEVPKGGVIRDPAVHRKALEDFTAALGRMGLRRVGLCVSPIRGASGNVEYLSAWRKAG